MLTGRLDRTHFLIGTRFTDAKPKLVFRDSSDSGESGNSGDPSDIAMCGPADHFLGWPGGWLLS